ncbi:Uma2 family endonuclease [Thermus sp.]|uniref:Uma2 family endonuclease n=1 Tax=Thermus sp. TaxID=275 RepID=UPI00307E3058
MKAARKMDLKGYLALEAESPIRHQLVEGGLWGMAGASRAHNALLTRLLLRIAPAALAMGCEAFAADRRLKTAEDTVFYPDLMVVCGPAPSPHYEEDACLLMEIPSESTEALDRGRKLAHYLRLPSLRTYLLVDSRFREVEGYFRGEGGFRHRVFLPGEEVKLPCPPSASGWKSYTKE